MRLNHSLRVQLTAWYGAVMAALLILFAGLLYILLAAGLAGELDRALQVRAADLASTLGNDEAGGIRSPPQSSDGNLNFQSDAAVQQQDELTLIYGPTGTVLEGVGPQLQPLPQWAGAVSDGRYATQLVGSHSWRLYARPLVLAGGVTGTLLVGRSLEATAATLRQTVTAILVAGPGLLLLGCVGGYFLAGRALAPIERINRTARQIQAQDLGVRIGSSVGQGEIGALAQTIDAMLERLEQAFVRQRRFTADAAHELRTPLAVVTAEASLALQRRRSPAEYQRVLTTVMQESERLRILVQDLLTLARTEQAVALGRPQRVALTDLCTQAVNRVRPQAAAKAVRIVVEPSGDPCVWGDPVWLGQLLGNLLDNAIKYSPPGGLVQVGLGETADWVWLAVADEGSGIEAQHLPHIFERFYRVDAARNRDSATAGVGLGLAICRWIVEAYAGTITVVSSAGQGARFTVQLPQLPIVARPAGAEAAENSP